MELTVKKNKDFIFKRGGSKTSLSDIQMALNDNAAGVAEANENLEILESTLDGVQVRISAIGNETNQQLKALNASSSVLASEVSQLKRDKVDSTTHGQDIAALRDSIEGSLASLSLKSSNLSLAVR